MSKYEPRHAEIKAACSAQQLKVSWAFRQSGLFVTVESAGNGDSSAYDRGRKTLSQFYQNLSMTSGGWGSATFKVAEAPKIVKEVHQPVVTVYLDFHVRTKDDTKREVRQNALFVQAKLIEAGLTSLSAKQAVEMLFSAGYHEGYESGYDQGRDDGDGDVN